MKSICASILALILLGTRAEASAIIFTDRDAFNAAVQPNATVGFGEPGHVFCNPSEGCPPDLTFDDGLFRFTADFATLSIGTVNGSPVINSINVGAFGFTVGGTTVPSLGVGFDIVPVGGPISVFTIGGTFTLSSPQFLGFLFDEPFTQLGWSVSPIPSCGTGPPCAASVSNISLRTVPEPATVLLLGASAVLLIGRRRLS